MNYRYVRSQVAVFLSIIVATMALSSCRQSTSKTAPVESVSVSEDSWQKNKECATQAEALNSRNGGALPDYEKSVQELAKGLSAAQSVGAIAASIRAHRTVWRYPSR